jgi:hypothetical protein
VKAGSKRAALIGSLIAALILSTSNASSATISGTKCSKVGTTKTVAKVKYTCIKNGKKLIWNKGVAIKIAPKLLPTSSPSAQPSANPTPTATEIKFAPWGTEINSKLLAEEAQKNFMSWVQSRTGAGKNHIQQIQENSHTNRIQILKKSDDLGAQLFSSYFKQSSVTIIGANEAWTLEQLAKNGWTTNTCNNQYQKGVELCLEGFRYQGYVINANATYDARNPGNDGAALLAHEYFHLVQSNLVGSRELFKTMNGEADSAKAIPIWFIEGTAEFVGYSVGALSQNASYLTGRPAALSYAPPGEATNKNSISDYEIRICCGNANPTYPYNIGQVATEYIVASIGFQKILDIFVDFGKTNDFEKSFQAVTGISKQAFYEKFDLIRSKVGLPAISWKLEGLVNKKIGG